MQHTQGQSVMQEFKEKFLRLHLIEDEEFEFPENEDANVSQKYPKKVQAKPHTIHHNDNKTLISDSQV